MSRETRLGLFT
jgi:hypothetical protein